MDQRGRLAVGGSGYFLCGALCKVYLRRVEAIAVLLSPLASLIFWCHPSAARDSAYPAALLLASLLINSIIIAPVSVWLLTVLATSTSFHVRRVGLLLAANAWFSSSCLAAQFDPGEVARQVIACVFVVSAGAGLFSVVAFLFKRWRLLMTANLKYQRFMVALAGSSLLSVLISCTASLAAVAACSFNLTQAVYGCDVTSEVFVFGGLFGFWLCCSVPSVFVIWSARRLVNIAVKNSPSDRGLAEARHADRSLKKHLHVLVAFFCNLLFRFATTALRRSMPGSPTANLDVVCTTCFAAVNLSCNCLFLASSWAGFKGLRERVRKDFTRQTRRSALTRSWRPSRDFGWNDTVVELAGRGISLDALLTFYEDLRERFMPHFNPDRHRTADVVRLAIIPATAQSCTSMAELLMEGEPTRPHVMVTHGWSNLFRDLLAAVCSEALCEPEYCRVAHLLDNDLGLLRSWLTQVGKLRRNYWICAFSVNQHRTMCNQNPNRDFDRVTGLLHPVCCCGAAKATDGTACEVNKFHDMMYLLAASDPNFRQAVAIDEDFDLFSRAWCVAELAAAHESGIAQSIVVSSIVSLVENADRLQTLRIQNMSASRPEDINEIMQQIGDPEAFNVRLRNLVCNELVPAWEDLDNTDEVKRVAQIIRWQYVAQVRISDGVLTASRAVKKYMTDGESACLGFGNGYASDLQRVVV